MEWANRLGIVLNLVATLLLTPEIFGALFGIEKIESFISNLKNRIHSFLSNYQKSIYKIFVRLTNILDDLFESTMKFAMMMTIFFLLCITTFGKEIFNDFDFISIFKNLDGISALIVYSLLVISLIIMIYYAYIEEGSSGVGSVLAVLPLMLPVMMVIMAFSITIALVISVSFLIYIIVLWILVITLSWVARVLNGNLRKIMIKFGLVILIIGFIFQFVATF